MLNRQRLIEERVYRRQRKRRKKNKPNKRKANQGMFPSLFYRVQSVLSAFLRHQGFFDKKYICKRIVAPRQFSFDENNDDCILFFKQIVSTFYLSDLQVVMDFSDCQNIAIPNAMMLDLIVKDFVLVEKRYNQHYYNKIEKKIKIKKSKHLKANKCLYVFHLIPAVDETKLGEAYLYLDNQVGVKSRKTFRNNLKGSIVTRVREFVNESLKVSNAILNNRGVNKLDLLLSEIFNNAEDHSGFRQWYVNGVSYRDVVENNEPIVELNLGILNFGYSISDGFFKNRDKNKKMMEFTDQWFEKHSSNEMFSQMPYGKDDLYTLYCLQEGVSRLKYEDQSRGSGTMNFLRAFIALGAYGKTNRKYKSHLNIISGNTIVRCTDEVEPYMVDNRYYLSLNAEHSMDVLPDSRYLSHTNEYFPGTFFEVKIYLNKRYFTETLKNKDGKD